MKPSSHPVDSAADEQASLWAARLDGDNLDSAQRAALDAWLAEKPLHRVLLTQYCQFSADLEVEVPALVATGAVVMPAPAQPPQRRPGTLRRLTTFALAVAAAVVLAIALLRPGSPVEHFAMASAERGTRTLADGTRVELNANTSLRFENGKTERRVRLTGGEALFFVAKDPTRPFFVETPTGSVRVTGTTFNVRTDASKMAFQVTVLEGLVEVRPGLARRNPPSDPVPLGAGQQLTARGSTASTRNLGPEALDDAVAWRVGTVIFDNTPLADALAQYARYYARTIEVAPAVAQQSVGGRFSIDDLSGFLHGVVTMLPVDVTYAPDGTVIVRARP